MRLVNILFLSLLLSTCSREKLLHMFRYAILSYAIAQMGYVKRTFKYDQYVKYDYAVTFALRIHLRIAEPD